MTRDPDVVVVGAGPNGLVAACRLARAGLDVLVLEARPDRPGGACWTSEATRPGFRHDDGASFFTFAEVSPAFAELPLAEHGVRFLHAPIDSAHPAPDGTLACVTRDPAAPFGSARDRRAWRRLADRFARERARLLPLLLGPLPPPLPHLASGMLPAARLGLLMARSGRGLARRLFEDEAARRALPALALHADAAPDDTAGAGVGLLLGLLGATSGFPVVAGGAAAFSRALVRILEAAGGRLRLGAPVARIVVRGGRARGVVVEGGEEIAVRRAVLADTDVVALLRDLVGPEELPPAILDRLARFRRGWGTFKVDWALGGAVPWTQEICRRSAVLHLGDDLDDLARFAAEVRSGRLPERPYLVLGQPSVADPARAPAGAATLWGYTHVPSHVAGGWDAVREAFADRIEARIEEQAPGFRGRILARRIMAPPDLERMDRNLVGGDIGGGTSAWNAQLCFRPLFPYFRHRMPVRGLFLGSSCTHPGPGVHGMCGANAADRLLGEH